MLANRVLVKAVIGIALLGSVGGCGKEKRAEEGQPPAMEAPPETTHKAPPPAAHPAKKTTTTHAAKPSKPSTKPATKPATKPSTKKPASSSLTLGVPEAHLPPAGQCRIWVEGKSVFEEPQARSCDGIVKDAPAGSMILERPSKESNTIHVRYIDAHKAGHVIKTRVFDEKTGKYLRDG